ncbi:membrane protein [Flavobacterium gelidilacus]|uniref:membrane protein n=1 Tax=Flavobacterium gelidilacus TaxID=206041 RepID=UPI00040AF088|nr:membrane protein [Flavobacterium gelidilacus]
MKNLLFLLILFCCQLSFSQKFEMIVEGSNAVETRTIDSIGFIKKHINVASIIEEQKSLEQKLQYKGYFQNELLLQSKLNDSIFFFKYSLKNQVQLVHIYIGINSAEEKELLSLKDDSIKLPIENVESFMQNKISLLEKKGYSLAKLKLTDYNQVNNYLEAKLVLDLNQKRNLTNIVIEGYDKFPYGIKKAILKKARRLDFNQDNVSKIYKDFNELRFVTQTKYPEILFTKDSTKVYVYLEKAKPNKFDGFIGFANDENSNLRFNGYLDLQLQNILNSGEKLNLFWKNDGKQQSSFNLGTEIPYMFKSPFGIKADLRIFKQDSTFQNTKTDLNLGYYFKYNSKVYLGYQNTTSVDIQNTNSFSINDFTNTFITSTFDFIDFNNDDFLFPEKTKFNIKLGTGNRTISSLKTNQFFGQVNFSHNLYLNEKNIINIKNETFYLQSDDYIVNELHRYGGINSIRGFSENSLQANAYSGILTEYRYMMAPSIYIHSIIDYGYFQDKTSNLSGNLLGLGFGFGLFTKNGLFNFIYANGSTNDQTIKLSNSIVHVSFKTYF